MTTTPDPKIHCLFEPGTDVRVYYNKYTNEHPTKSCKVYKVTTRGKIYYDSGVLGSTDIDDIEDINYVYGEIVDVVPYMTYHLGDTTTGYDNVNGGVVIVGRGSFSPANSPCSDIGGSNFRVRNIFSTSYGVLIGKESDSAEALFWEHETTIVEVPTYEEIESINETDLDSSDYDNAGEVILLNNNSAAILDEDGEQWNSYFGIEGFYEGGVYKLQPEESINVNTIVPLLSGIEVKGSFELPSMPENCIEIWRYIQGAPLPTRMKVKRLCSDEGCPPPEYTVDCEPCFPPGLIEVKCGDFICCYNKQGEAVKQCP